MPYYCWRPKGDKDMERVVEVMRSFKEYEDPPTEEELVAANKPTDVEYERVIGGKIKVTKAPGFGCKGYW